LDKVLDSDYYVEERMGLDCSISFKNADSTMKFTGYNDIILHRGLSMKLLPIISKINDSKEELIFADGMVVATPNGSSAYNVSAGGPLLSTSSRAYVVTPICPQSRIFTSLVISQDDIVHLSVSSKSSIKDNEMTISCDGFYNSFISSGDEIVIKKSDKGLKMIRFNEKESMYQSAHKALNSIKKKGEK
jgi:NAD+ kinase